MITGPVSCISTIICITTVADLPVYPYFVVVLSCMAFTYWISMRYHRLSYGICDPMNAYGYGSVDRFSVFVSVVLLPSVTMFWCAACTGLGEEGRRVFLWPVGLCEGVKDCIRKYGVGVVWMTVSSKLCMGVETFDCG